MQNWTSKKFHNKYKDEYKKETDSENLLVYIEKHAKWIYQIPDVLNKLKKDLTENFWIIIIKDDMWNILVWMDWKRESNIELNKDKTKIVRITNYPKNKNEWFKNVWYIIFDEAWNIKKNAFDKINVDEFIAYSYVASTTWYSYNSGYGGNYTPATTVAKSANKWNRWAKWDKDLFTWRKAPIDMTELELEYYATAGDFFWTSLEDLGWITLKECMEWYLAYHYWVNDEEEYYKTYKSDIGWFWIKEAAIEVLEVL